MKVCFLVSLVSLAFSGWSLFRTSQKEGVTREAINAALAEREKEVVARLKPRFQRMFAEMGAAPNSDENPETIEELLDPLLKMIEMMEGAE